MPDGGFLTPVSGLHYVIHLFDQSVSMLSMSALGPDLKIAHVQESVRVHDDRLAYLENRHGHLAGKVSTKMAAEAEFSDWVVNRSEENWVTILGLPRLSITDNRAWQEAARKQVIDLFKTVLRANRTGLDYTIMHIGSPTRFRSNGVSVLNVKLDSVHSSSRIRELYSGFFRHNRPVSLPAHLRGVSVRNKVTLESRIRLEIMKQLGPNYKASNPDSTVKVRGYGPRPTMVIFPAPASAAPSGGTASSTVRRRSQTFDFIQAVTKLPVNFTDENLARIFQIVGPHNVGELRQLYIVLSDDNREQCEALVRSHRRDGSGPSSAASVTSGLVSGPGTGTELEAGFVASLRDPPPPPPVVPPADAPKELRARSRSGSRSCSIETEPPSRKVTKKKDKRSRSRSRSGSHSRSRSREKAKRGSKRHRKQSRSHKRKKNRRSRSSSSSDSSGSSTSSSRTSEPPKKSGKDRER